ncbi:hypothetical protein TL16_g03081 [Triparma laevis f. inornata]|uniref:Uncharacterized protein n=1 Tax=Triparma laevis f. inornata TaxID=1714386 RepID=A0A9W7DXX2_9STRA|nr:hypothetical protein TL16_g03081 [Triparma laevis f. inornata]
MTKSRPTTPGEKKDAEPEVSDAAKAAMEAEKKEDEEKKKKKKEEQEAKEAEPEVKEIVLKPGEELFHADKHPSYKPFFKQIMTGVPKNTVKKAMERKFLDPEFLDNPKAKVVYRPKPPHKKTALDVINEEEARQAIKEEEKEKKAAEESVNLLDQIDWNKPEFQGFVGLFRKIKVYAETKKKMIEQNAFKYGPPYNDDYGGSILEECNKPNSSTLDVHQMLLEGADPRVQEEQDFRNTSLHYACRYCHSRIAKMLYKAKCEVDVTNELGITPLGTLCMFNQPEPRHYLHLKFVTWILDIGVEVNHVDKGGHTALEFAAKHGNVDLVALLLRYGARVKRDAQFISLQTVDLLDPEVCEDATCRQLLRTKYNEEVRIEMEAAEAERKAEEERLQKLRDAERKRMIELARLNKANAHLERQLYEKHLAIEELKKTKREEARRKRLRLLEEKKNENGTWKKFGKFDWQFVEGKKQKNVSVNGSVYDEAKALNDVMQVNHGHAMMNKRWKEITGRNMVTVEGVTDMGYGIDDISKEERERIKEEEKYGLNVKDEESEESDDDLFKEEGEEGGGKNRGEDEDGDEGKVPEIDKGPMKMRRRMSITGTTLQMPTLPKID